MLDKSAGLRGVARGEVRCSHSKVAESAKRRNRGLAVDGTVSLPRKRTPAYALYSFSR